MRSLVHRRHSLREPGAAHLSPEGVELARRVGRVSGRFDRVVTSPHARAIETAEAMGFVVDAQLEELGTLPAPIGRLVDRGAPSTFDDFVRWVATLEEAREFAAALARAWRGELTQTPEGGRLLMISHRGIVELGAVGAVRDRATGWGSLLAPLEGVRLDWDRGRWVHAEVLRHPA